MSCQADARSGAGGGRAYPEVNVEVACATKLAIADLVGDAHLVILVQALVEALEAVGRQDDVVCRGGRRRDGGDEESPCGGEEVHCSMDSEGCRRTDANAEQKKSRETGRARGIDGQWAWRKGSSGSWI